MAGKDGNDGSDDGDFALAVLQASQQDCVMQQLRKIFPSSIAPLEDALRQLNETNAALCRQIADRDETIRKLEDRVTELELRNDDIEQQGRKWSIRIFGLPGQGQGTLEEKLMKLCNDHLMLRPPICEDDIEVAHRLGKPPPNPQPNDESSDPSTVADAQADAAPRSPRVRPRAVLVKLASAGRKGGSWMKDLNSRTTHIHRKTTLMLCALEMILRNIGQPWLSELGNPREKNLFKTRGWWTVRYGQPRPYLSNLHRRRLEKVQPKVKIQVKEESVSCFEIVFCERCSPSHQLVTCD